MSENTWFTNGWFGTVRRIIYLMTGVALIAFAATSPGHDISFLVTGLILLGLIPTDELLGRLPRRSSPRVEGD